MTRPPLIGIVLTLSWRVFMMFRRDGMNHAASSCHAKGSRVPEGRGSSGQAGKRGRRSSAIRAGLLSTCLRSAKNSEILKSAGPDTSTTCQTKLDALLTNAQAPSHRSRAAVTVTLCSPTYPKPEGPARTLSPSLCLHSRNIFYMAKGECAGVLAGAEHL